MTDFERDAQVWASIGADDIIELLMLAEAETKLRDVVKRWHVDVANHIRKRRDEDSNY